MAELLIAGLGKAFGARQVLDAVSLRVASGTLTAVLGASGSGKTTLLRLLAGFERADRGTIAIGGETVAAPGRHLLPERRRIGYVAQEGALFPHLSVAGNVAFGLPAALRRDRRAVGAKVAALLDMVGLPEAYATRPPHELSGGEQQRVALARALAPSPRLVLLDEPFSALDAALRLGTRRAVADAIAAAGATALLVTHDQSEALSMGREVGVLRRGRLVQVASPIALYQRPLDAELAAFVGEAVLIPGFSSGTDATCALGTLQLAHGMPAGRVEIMLRPEQLVLAEGQGPIATVRTVSFQGPEASVSLALPSGLALLARVPGHLAPPPGAKVNVQVVGDAIAYRADPAAP
jgi:iron(III) transport system ATP-binding protein